MQNWTNQEEQQLREHYEDKSPSELFEIIGRSEGGIVLKLQRLSAKDPDAWDKKRIAVLTTQYSQECTAAHPEKQKMYANKCRIYKKFIEREREWSERDTHILATTYFNHDWKALTRIFRLKNTSVHDKLRELYEQDKDAWDIDTIEELEKQAKECSFEEVRGALGYGVLPRYKNIDELIFEKKLNQRAAGEQLGKCRATICEYLRTRGLRDQYYGIQENKKRVERQRKSVLNDVAGAIQANNLARAQKEDPAFYYAQRHTLKKGVSASFEETYQKTRDIFAGYNAAECAVRWGLKRRSVYPFLYRTGMIFIYHQIQKKRLQEEAKRV